MTDDKLLLSPFGAGHMEDIDKESGTEFIAGSTTILQDPDFFLKNTSDKQKAPLVNQLEFSEEYGRCLCTAYGTLWVAMTSGGFVLSKEDRLSVVKERVSQMDFDKNVGGFITVAVDVWRRWWNARHPENPCVTFMIQNDSKTRRDFFDKKIPLVRGMRGNRAFTIDSVDGVMNSLNYPLLPNEKWYGHCTGMIELTIADNYLREYKYKSVDDYYKMRKALIEGSNSWAIFFEDQLSDRGKAWVKMIRLGVTNGADPDRALIRRELEAWLLKLCPGVNMKKVWSGKEPERFITRYEFVAMCEKAIGRKAPIQVYSEQSKNTLITRGEALQILASW